MGRRWLIPAVVGALLAIPGSAVAAPVNDDFADATPATMSFVDVVDTTDATDEPGEPEHCNGSAAVWYRLEALSDSTVVIDTLGSNFDTVLAVYTGEDLGSLDLVDCNDDSEFGLLSRIYFQAVAGETYHIQAGGFNGNTGELQFNVRTPGSVEGTVTADGGAPLEGICVSAHTEVSPDDEYYDYLGSTLTNDDGSYRLEGVDGTVLILFEDCDDQRYTDEWYDDAASPGTATPVVVPGGGTVSGVDAVMTLGGSITGRITDLDGAGLDGLCVEASTPDGRPVESSFSEHDGTYRVGALPTGTYAVSINRCGPILVPRPVPHEHGSAELTLAGNDYESEWFDDKPTLDEADLVAVIEGIDTPGIDAALALRPRPDVAVTAVSVENVPLVTDAGPLPTGTGWNRRISVTVENVGEVIARGTRIAVRACTISDGACELLALQRVPIGPGRAISASIDWNALGSVGDVSIIASVHHYDDPNGRNDIRTVRHYVMVGGTGMGVSACGFGPTPNICP